jgi:hypothetical protein
MGEQVCKRCRFWDNANGQVGYCHRRAPGTSPQGSATWPMTSSHGWCGEFEAPQPNVDEGDGK